MANLRERVERELLNNILPFWLKHCIDDEYGGFRGQITNDLQIDPVAHKGLILNARILWTFSKTYEVYKNEIYLRTAKRAYKYLMQHFWDRQFGGVFWMVDFQGKPVSTDKHSHCTHWLSMPTPPRTERPCKMPSSCIGSSKKPRTIQRMAAISKHMNVTGHCLKSSD